VRLAWTRWFVVVTALAVTPAQAAPQRIASMNLCTDQMALLLADKSRIVSVSFLGADPAESPLAHLSDGLHINHGNAEEIIALKPDLVLAGLYTTGFAKAMLRRLGYAVVEIDSPRTIPTIHTILTQMGEILGEQQRAADLLADMDARLDAVKVRAAAYEMRRAIVYDANGFTVGRPGLADDVMTLAGFENLAPALGIEAFGQVPIEAMLRARPDHIISLVYRPNAASIAGSAIKHPAIAAALKNKGPITVQGSLLNCGTPMVADAAEHLVAAREASP